MGSIWGPPLFGNSHVGIVQKWLQYGSVSCGSYHAIVSDDTSNIVQHDIRCGIQAYISCISQESQQVLVAYEG